VTAAIDVMLGLGAVAFAGLLSDSPWAITAAGAMVVVGHNWSAFIRLGGGIGLSSLGGALLWHWPLPTLGTGLGAIGVWLVLVRLAQVHRARATIIVLALIGPVLWALGVPLHGVVLALLGGAAAIIKTLPDWDRQYGPVGITRPG
jgi:glycerol-3-phosphate acyltransferase PlsY